MKLNKQTIALLLLICLSAEAIPLSAQTKKKGLKKTANISLNITNKKNFPPKTGLNIGLLSNFSRLNGVGINLISSIVQAVAFHGKKIYFAIPPFIFLLCKRLHSLVIICAFVMKALALTML